MLSMTEQNVKYSSLWDHFRQENHHTTTSGMITFEATQRAEIKYTRKTKFNSAPLKMKQNKSKTKIDTVVAPLLVT